MWNRPHVNQFLPICALIVTFGVTEAMSEAFATRFACSRIEDERSLHIDGQ